MAVCPDGHQSGATDYCDVCGLSIGAPSAAAAPTVTASVTPSASGGGEPCPNCLLPRSPGDTFCEGCGFDFANEQPVAAAKVKQPDPIDIEEELRKAEQAAKKAAATTTTAASSATATADPLAETVLDGPQPVSPPAPSSTGTKWVAVANADRAYYDAVVAEGEIDAADYPFPPFCPERRFVLSGENIQIGRSSATRGAVEIDLSGPPADPGVSHLHAVLQARPDGGWSVIDMESTNGTVLNDDTAPIPSNQAIPVEEGHRIHVGIWTTLTLVQE